MIHIDTSSVQGELREHPDFELNVEYAWELFNSALFTPKAKAIICLHEATHLVYCRELGFEPELFGPAVIYDEDSERFRIVDSSVEQLPREIRMFADDVLLVAKHYLGPVFTEQRLINSHRTEKRIWADAKGDLRNFNNWAGERQRLFGDVMGHVSFEAIRDSVYKDCRKPAFRKKLWDAAREFEARVFGKPN